MVERGSFFKENLISEPRKGWHNLSFDNTFSCNAGKLYVTKCLEVFPGDVIHDKSSGMARLLPLVAPVMGKLNMFSYHFIVRNRDIWTQWDKFITNSNQKKTWQQNLNFTPPAMPYIDIKEVYWNIFAGLGTISHISQMSNVYYLAIWQHNGRSYCTISKSYPTNVTGYARGQVIAFIPNKNDLFNENDKYNPFCAGSLLDFLGINIDGFVREQGNNFVGVYNSVMNYYDIDANLTNVWPYQFTDTDLTEAGLESELGISGAVYAGFTYDSWYEWLDCHLVLGMCCAFDKTGYTGIVGNLLADGTYNQTGTPTITGLNFGISAFDPSNASLYDFKLTDLALRAYRFIYDEYFRDENYIEVNNNTDFSRDGNDLDWNNVTVNSIYQYLTYAFKAYEHDLYTTALPQAQKGNPVRFLPDSPIKTGDQYFSPSGSKYNGVVYFDDAHGLSSTTNESTSSSDANRQVLVTDLSAATIENLRFYNAMQRYLELKARTGSRYYEYMIGQWGFAIEDSKLNRPIYLSGDRTPVQISEVTQTSASDVQTGQPLGDLAGRGVAISEDDFIDFTSPDYGFLIEIVCVVPRTSYGQGIKPMFKRTNYMDYPLPGFANLGEEPIKKRELYATLRKVNDDATFGYSSRYYQFKYERDQSHGDMLTTLRHWNFTRFFDGVPYNGQTFLEVKPSYRQFAVTDSNEDHFLVTMWHDIQINRALPEHTIPSL